MFIYNLKINNTKIFKIIIILIIVFIFVLSVYLFWIKDKFIVNDSLPSNSIAHIESNQYTNILREVYNDIDTYIGQSISFTGYVYKLYDLKDTEFVLARDMIINSDSQSVVVGFLCSYEKAKEFKEGTWVNITGTIIKGYYHNEIPVIDITKIEETKKPDDCFVYPPDDTYINTCTII